MDEELYTNMIALKKLLPDYPNLLQAMEDAAIAAGKEIMDIYSNEKIAIDWKADDSPLTIADLRAHNLITTSLEQKFPDIPLVSEEGEGTNNGTKSDIFFLVDPLDGTKEFIKKTGEFTVNIALVIQSKSELGVVYLPAKDILYATSLTGSAVMISAASKKETLRSSQRISVRSIPAQGPTIIMSASHSSDETRDYSALYNPSATLSAGSSLKFCKVAEGKADFYPRLGRTMEWDIAASHAVLKAAGGNVYNLKDATELSYGKPGLENGYFIACASSSQVIKCNLDWRS